MNYHDIKTAMSDGKCDLCKIELKGGDSPWSICYDPEWEINCWGGDTHEYRAVICQSCAERILKNKTFQRDE